MKIVQFKNGKFAVRRAYLFGFQYLGDDGFWWSGNDEYKARYCLLETADDARKRAQKHDYNVIWKGSIR